MSRRLSGNYPDTNTPMLDTPVRQFKQVVAVTSVSLGTFCAGTVLSWTSPALSHIEILPNATEPISSSSPPNFTVNSKEAAVIASTLTIGALVSAIPTGYFADKVGRKITVIALAAAFFVNWCLIGFANNFTIVVAARFFAGIGLGGICVVAPMYIGEITHASYRGLFGSFLQLFLSGGILFTCLAGNFVNWTYLSVILAIVPVLLGATFAFMPESPVYLLGKNKRNRAEKNLQELRGPFYDISDEINGMEQELMEHAKNAGIIEVVTNRAHMRAIVSAVGVLAFQQLCGINAIVFYTLSIFRAAGTDVSPFLSAVIIDLTQFLCSFVPIVVTEKANRKFFLMLSSIGMMICLTGLGMFFHLKIILSDASFLAFIPLSSLVLFMVSFCMGYGPVPWMLLSELFAPEIKGIASGFAILCNWMCAFLVTFSFPISNAAFGSHVTFYILGCVMGIATLFVHFVVPETRGKTLAQIQDEMNR
ncbi:facilitated trehalose transporter Tret1-like [Diorhabda sublineata]|uniref:facilitated trehalose transporter Tret1-like n=1 Tax=Diorhabda sublineata TaxID=1163346 RepID=UPI0024E0EBE4|nr:facilitated trehalose transporter Tret1-like [Diorhabda sublineata]